MFFVRPDPRKWYIPYGKVVCGKCARNKPTELMEYTPPISCGICGIEKGKGQFLVYMIAEKPQIERTVTPRGVAERCHLCKTFYFQEIIPKRF